ncbi:HAD superfamily (subfamily IG) hydrolase, 5'-Nucleotidase [Plesiocystis pacifica SIR-1]|uniref:HAD superfamily (Subfamily IG) hydrolase, 5'-Nucleotidase n=1 Tax=Plesiocystis pacifica SIR-1 TaxID=391625 RepID=A6FY99_9BACT|nr:HAD-IG family 5'-nucleotidase [Plesiocystis pacifica]EDM81478.1 HAD superfamily (subfamily IG) hydrolase, 5'-Nucleotidase [Plesiocystis pacifica SIR-1]
MSGAQDLPEPIRHLLHQVGHQHDSPRTRRVFTNRDLDFESIPVVGFDMDYTLARYRQHPLEALSLEATVAKLIDRGWPEQLRGVQPDPEFAIRGLVVDTRNGNLLKMDRHGYVGRVYHGRRMLSRPERKALYSSQRVGRERSRFAYVDTLFALPEVTLYAAVVDLIDAQPELWGAGAPSYAEAWDAVRKAIDLAHQDDSIKSRIKADVAAYFDRDPDLAPTLHKLRSAGKKLFLLTNSYYPYTQAVMAYLLDGALEAYGDWTQYFDWMIVGSRKPSFFSDAEPFLEIDRVTGEVHGGPRAQPQRNRVFQGGNQAGLQAVMGCRPDQVIYVGDHIYGDIVHSKKTSGWRTVLIVEELERELRVRADYQPALDEIRSQSDLWEVLSEAVSEQRYLQRGLRQLDAALVAQTYAARGEVLSEANAEVMLGELRAEAKARFERLREHEDEVAEAVKRRSVQVDRAFNHYWGSVFTERYDASFFGEQLVNYACLYTSRVSNFLFVSPNRYFRAPHGSMPHWF